MFLLDKRIPGAQEASGIWYDGAHTELIEAARSIQPAGQIKWGKRFMTAYYAVIFSFGAGVLVWAATRSFPMSYAAFAGGVLTVLLATVFATVFMPWYNKMGAAKTFEAAVAKGLALATSSQAYALLDDELQDYGFEGLDELDAAHPGLVAEVMPAYLRLFRPHEARLADEDPAEQQDARLAMSRMAQMAAEAIVAVINLIEYDDTVDNEED